MQIRLYTPEDLSLSQEIILGDSQTHYLRNVLRINTGEDVFLFNAKDGEYYAVVTEISKKKTVLTTKALARPQPKSHDIRLYFAPLKKENTDLVIQKATELGATFICPTMTAFTHASRVNLDRLNLIAIEAAEQSRRLTLPKIVAPEKLSDILAHWDQTTSPPLFHLDEKSCSTNTKLPISPNGVAFLIGPEGGFSDQERDLIKSYSFTKPLSLGENILRAETAVIASLALYQYQCG